MNVNGINGNNAGVQSFQMNMNQGTDSVSKNLQNQIANAQKQMQELGQDKEMSLEEKMKKRQEIQQQISDLQNQLRQHQIEQRKESQQKKGSSMDDMLGGNKQTSKSAKGGTGMSSASMQAIISADSSMNQVKVQGSVKTQMEGKAGVLESEIKLDAGRGDDVTKKKEELADIEAKAQDITASQMNSLSDINKKLEEAAKEDQKEEKAADKAEKSDETDKAKGTVHKATETEEHTEVQDDNVETTENILPEGVEINVTEPVGNNVDVKL